MEGKGGEGEEEGVAIIGWLVGSPYLDSTLIVGSIVDSGHEQMVIMLTSASSSVNTPPLVVHAWRSLGLWSDCNPTSLPAACCPLSLVPGGGVAICMLVTLRHCFGTFGVGGAYKGGKSFGTFGVGGA